MTKKAKEPRFVLNLDMPTEMFQYDILNIRFEVARKILNRCKYKMEQNLRAMKKDDNYIYWVKEPKSEKRTIELNSIRESYDLSKNGAERIIKSIAKEYKRQAKIAKRPKTKMKKIMPDGSIKIVRKKRKRTKTDQPHIDSATAQALSERAWDSLESLLFGKGKKAHFKKFGQLESIQSKSNDAGIRYTGGFVEWNGLKMPVSIDKNDTYAQKALHHEIAYCRIVRHAVRGKYNFYLQLVLKGIPPQKHKTGNGKSALDIGISTLAVVNNKSCRLVEFCEGIDELYKTKRLLQRKLDRSRRATNPNNYNLDGTVKKASRKWVRSKRYIKTLFELKEIYRKIAALRQIMHNKEANLILKDADEVYCEDMNYKGMQKGWFGKKISEKAPSTFLTTLDRKLKYQGKKLIKINTWKVKASQYDPYSNSYKKKKLSKRYHTTGDGYIIQRDCFSAFLIYHVNKTLDSINRNTCLNDFQNFYTNYKNMYNKMQSSNKKYPVSMGI